MSDRGVGSRGRWGVVLVSLVAVGLLCLAAWIASVGQKPAGIAPRDFELRNRGLAELENEQPELAERSFAALVERLPDDALAYANLAIATLRQGRPAQALPWIDQALDRGPERGDLLMIRAAILEAAARPDDALADAEAAAAHRPDDPEAHYALYRLAEQLESDRARVAASGALDALARLRPENAVVLLARGRGALAAEDPAAATASFLRLMELAPDLPARAMPYLAAVLDALEAADLGSADLPARRLENLVRASALYQAGLRELTEGIQGVPVLRFAGEPAPTSFGDSVPVVFHGRLIEVMSAASSSIVVEDLDGDGQVDIARVRDGTLVLHRASRRFAAEVIGPTGGMRKLMASDLSNDGTPQLVGIGSAGLRVWRVAADEVLDESESFDLSGARAHADARSLELFDFDLEGDLDLVVGGAGLALYRNSLDGALTAVASHVLPSLAPGPITSIRATDLDRDGDLDLLVSHGGHLAWLDNLRQSRFRDRTPGSGLEHLEGIERALSADLDNDGRPDLIAVGPAGLVLRRNGGDRFEPFESEPTGRANSYRAVVVFDADNDGRLDLALAGDDGLEILRQSESGSWTSEGAQGPGATQALDSIAAADLDGDGDLDLVAGGPKGLWTFTNDGGSANRWLEVQLRALTRGSSKNNAAGVGSVVEVRAGSAYQFREARGSRVHFGLGRVRRPDSLRVVWTNGVPQNRLAPGSNQLVVEEQLLKGSCPFLYAWDGERFAFVTDLLWGAPLGLPVAEGIWASPDPDELVHVPGAVPDADGAYRFRITEELWEAAFFDRVRLRIVDHPQDVEVASSLKIVPGVTLEDRVLATRGLAPVARAWDGRGQDVTERVRTRDERYASGFEIGPYQGVAAQPWTFTFDLGVAPEAPIRLHLDGWIFPADASLNLAVAQRAGPPPDFTRLEVEGPDGWQVLVPKSGHPAGKTKTMVIDTPPLPAGARRLRIRTHKWLAWDRIAWGRESADDEPVLQASLSPTQADLQQRGFSRMVRSAPNAPHGYIYEESTTDSPWLPFAGGYTRYGDVRELLQDADDRTVILAPGDEIDLRFDASALAPPAPGWRRAVFLESSGWDKDADRNTWQAAQLEPLPFRAMSSYPFAPGEHYPDEPALAEYRSRWLTRVVN